MKKLSILIALTLAALVVSCSREDLVPTPPSDPQETEDGDKDEPEEETPGEETPGDENPDGDDPQPADPEQAGYDPYGDNHGKLPVIRIDTPGGATIDSKENWVEQASFSIEFPNGRTENYGFAKIKLRGNSTLYYPKKSFNFKLDKKASLVNMPEDKSWCLLAQWMDRTLLRNDVAFEIARRTHSLGWTPRGEFVELILNGEFLGTYYLCEKIKIARQRVITAEDGYILELDTYYDEEYKFKSEKCNLPVMLKEPDPEDITPEFFDGVKTFFNKAELYLTSCDCRIYCEFIDMDSFIDWIFVHELTSNYEPSHPKSTYMFLAPDGKLHAGPVWDFDWGTFKPNNKGLVLAEKWWFKYFFADPYFIARLKQKWNEELPVFLEISDYIDRRVVNLRPSAESNIRQWPISGNVNGDEQLSYHEAVQRMKHSYEQRLCVLDQAISDL
ncbi:MAG: CotH kinase family protein [Candidatus Cryptobacteroides sp.]